MDPKLLIPPPDHLQVDYGWFSLLSLLTFTVHLLLMNAMLGLTMLAFWREFRAKTGAAVEPVAKAISSKIPTLTALTVNFAVPPLLFLQVLYGQFHYPSAVLMGPYWLAMFVIVILAYYSAYYFYMRYEKMPQSRRAAVIGAALLLYLSAAFILVNKMTLMLRPEAWAAYITSGGAVMLNLGDPALIPRYLHFLAASAAIGGLATAIVGHVKRDKDPEGSGKLVRLGLTWFTTATMSQMVFGGLFVAALPRPVMMQFAGGNLLYTSVFVASVLMTFVCLIMGMRRKICGTVIAAVVTVFLMTLMRDFLRLAYLEPYFKPSDLPVVPQISPMLVFLVSFVIVGGLIAHMLKLALRSARNGEE